MSDWKRQVAERVRHTLTAHDWEQLRACTTDADAARIIKARERSHGTNCGVPAPYEWTEGTSQGIRVVAYQPHTEELVTWMELARLLRAPAVQMTLFDEVQP